MYAGVQHRERGAPKVVAGGPGAGDAASESGKGQQAGGAGAAWEGRAQGPAPNPGLPGPAPARPDGAPALPSARRALEATRRPGLCPGIWASLQAFRGLRSGADPLPQRSRRGQGQPDVDRAAARPRARSRARGHPPLPRSLPRAGASGSDRLLLAGAEGRGGRCSESSLLREEGGGAKEPLLCSGAPGRAWGSPRLSPAGSPPLRSALPLSRRGRGLLSCGPEPFADLAPRTVTTGAWLRARCPVHSALPANPETHGRGCGENVYRHSRRDLGLPPRSPNVFPNFHLLVMPNLYATGGCLQDHSLTYKGTRV